LPDPADLGLREAVAAVAGGGLSPGELFAACRARAESLAGTGVSAAAFPDAYRAALSERVTTPLESP